MSRRSLGHLWLRLALTAACMWPASAAADGPVGSDPAANRPVGKAPAECRADPQSAACVNAAVADLDAARASVGKPPYPLPADFPALGATRQVFILVNLDRVSAGLTPVAGLTDALNADAMAGALNDVDPHVSDSTTTGATSNWAGGFQSMLYAYDAWMFDDGPGSGNADCTLARATGCWGHRHDVLWAFSAPTLAMGAASGHDGAGHTSHTMLIAAGPAATFLPLYTYSWTQAVDDGAGTHVYTPPRAAGPRTAPATKAKAKAKRLKITSVAIHGARVRVTISAPAGSHLQCSLAPFGVRGHWVACGRITVFQGVVPGHYRLRVRTRARRVARAVSVAA